MKNFDRNTRYWETEFDVADQQLKEDTGASLKAHYDHCGEPYGSPSPMAERIVWQKLMSACDRDPAMGCMLAVSLAKAVWSSMLDTLARRSSTLMATLWQSICRR